MNRFSFLQTLIELTMKEYTLWDTVQMFYYMVKFFGYISFSIDGKIEKGRIKSTICDVAIVTTGSLILTYIIYVNFTNDLTLILTESFIIDKGTRFITMLMIVNIFVTAIINTARRRKIWKVFRQFHEFDKEVVYFSVMMKISFTFISYPM